MNLQYQCHVTAIPTLALHLQRSSDREALQSRTSMQTRELYLSSTAVSEWVMILTPMVPPCAPPQKKNKKMAIRNSWNPLFQKVTATSLQRGLAWHGMTRPSLRHQSSWECRMPLIPQFRRCTKRVWRPVLAMARMATGRTAILAILMRFHWILLGRNIWQSALEWWSKYIQMPWHHPSRPQISHRPRLNGKSPGALFPSALSCEGGNIRDKPWLAMKKGNYGKLRGWKI